MSIKNSNETFVNRTRVLPVCSSVSQPTPPRRAPQSSSYMGECVCPSARPSVCPWLPTVKAFVAFSRNSVRRTLWKSWKSCVLLSIQLTNSDRFSAYRYSLVLVMETVHCLAEQNCAVCWIELIFPDRRQTPLCFVSCITVSFMNDTNVTFCYYFMFMFLYKA